MTNPSTSGNLNSDELLEQLDNILEEYENSHNITTSKRNIDKYLNMSRDEITKLDHQSCLEIAYELTCHSIYIQSVYNKESGRVKYAKHMVRTYCCPEWNNYKNFFMDDMRISAIAKGNSAVNKILKIKNHAEQRLERLVGVASNIKYLSDIFKEIGKSKRYAQN